jgi:hypothetical protein
VCWRGLRYARVDWPVSNRLWPTCEAHRGLENMLRQRELPGARRCSNVIGRRPSGRLGEPHQSRDQFLLQRVVWRSGGWLYKGSFSVYLTGVCKIYKRARFHNVSHFLPLQSDGVLYKMGFVKFTRGFVKVDFPLKNLCRRSLLFAIRVSGGTLSDL